VIERAVIISKSPVLNVALGELQPDATQKPREPAPNVTSPKHENLPEQENLRHVLNETERTQILRALEACNGLITGPNGAAARLGIKRSTLQLRMQKLGIRRTRTAFIDRQETTG
jgi:formate hydrogenlyase transcriptional activator